VRANLPSLPGLQPGLFGRLQFPCATRPTLSIPAAALVTRGQLDLVYVVEPDHAAPSAAGAAECAYLRLITVGRTQKDWVEVLSGLSTGERVVLSPPATLRDGAPVKLEAEAK